ncbi:TerB N-terminal domain-containing protein [Acidithiobacillus sp. MC6.1]|nr:TerB N-terminal domain-containing protein [Acidithiobacillus sp. MC6.1]
MTLIAAILNKVWISAAILAALGIAVYLYTKSKNGRSTSADQYPPVAEHRPSAANAPAPLRIIVQSVARFTAADELVSADTSQGQATFFRTSSAPEGFGAASSWVPPGQSVIVSGITIPDGMVYVGTKLPTPSGSNDPCLINLTKSVARQGDYTERQMGYWPSYSEISGGARRAYLNWLAGGRKDPEADIGYVFLFFYGLEHRVIIDAAKDETARVDWSAITAEIHRLLAIYGPKSGSFRGYAGALLDWVTLVEHPAHLYEKAVPSFPKTFELPLYIRLALGQASVDGAPVPAHLALAWAKLEPNIYFRTPATRCAAKFEQLFAAKYAETFGAGMILPRNRTKLKLVYRPASAGLHGYEEINLTFRDTPDVTVQTVPTKKLQEIVEAATKPLESFSRLVGKNPDAKSSLEALLQLPEPLWPESAQNALQALKARMGVGMGMVTMSFKDLLSTLGARAAFTKDKTLSLARVLESASVGIEPDVLSGAKLPRPEDKVVLFALPVSEPVERSSGPYLAAALTLQLASAVASADGEFSSQEMEHLRKTVLSWKHLTPSQTRRLLAHLRLLIQAPASLASLTKKFETLDMSVKDSIAAFMATVAQADGEISLAELKMLEKVYKALGVDSNRVFTNVHAVSAGKKITGTTFAKAVESGFKLDPARIAELQKDTERVSALLANIFTEAEEPQAVSFADPQALSSAESMDSEQSQEEAAEPAKGLLGLDEAHSALARMLLSRPEWSREELLDVAADLDLMLDGALEQINEAAFDTHDLPFFEGEDPLTVNAEILEKVEA